MGENSWNGFESNPLYLNLGNGQFADVARPLGSDCKKDSRGVGIADLDRDGRLDLVITNNNAEPLVLLNDLTQTGNYLLLDLEGVVSQRNAIGAVVEIPKGDRTLTRQVQAGAGFASQRMHTLHFGLGEVDQIEGLTIRWPSGHVDSFDAEAVFGLVNQTVHFREGSEVLSKPRDAN